MKNNILLNKARIITLFLSMGFYCFFALTEGAVICVDSASYIGMELYREPLYPAFLAFFRWIFGSETNQYLNVAALFQCILAGISTWILIEYAVRLANLASIFRYIFLTVCLSISLLCRFVAQRGSMYNNCIMTESICIPLIMVFSRLILAYCIEKKRTCLIFAVALSIIMISVRKQMLITLLLLLVAVVFVECRRGNNSLGKRLIRAALISGICAAAIIGGKTAIDYSYNFLAHGGMFTHVNDNRFFTTVIFYVSERDDGQFVENKDIQNLYYKIYDACDSEGSMMHYAGNSLIEKNIHFANHYDLIQIDHMRPMIEEYVEDKNPMLPKSEREIIVDEISQTIAWSIFPHVSGKVLRVFTQNYVYGLVNTVGKATIPLMYPYAIIVILLYIALLIYNINRNGLTNKSVFALYALIAVLINVAGVSLTIFCQVRYMIYTMPLFYMGLIMLGTEALKIGGDKPY